MCLFCQIHKILAAFSSLAESLFPVGGIQPEGDGAIVDQGDLHIGTELSGLSNSRQYLLLPG